ncbi:MAG: hypothetical protein JWO78_560 [Micavibrio sp.]|nr:hypothetical protein [Micavibrio sp.]
MYISDELRQQVRMQQFRDALSGVKKVQSPGPEKRVSDFGISEKIDPENPGDFAPLISSLAREGAIEDALANGDEHAITQLEKEPSPVLQKISSGDSVAALQKMRTGGAATDTDRIEAVISRKASVQTSCDYLERPRHDTFNTLAAHNAALDISNNADPRKHDVNAVQMMMENIFDWDSHDRHNGENMTPPQYYKLAKSLRVNLEAACPVMKNDRIFDHFEMLANRFMGDFLITKARTQEIVEAGFMAQIGDVQSLDILRERLCKTAAFYDRFYPNLGHPGKLPMKAIANAMEKHADRGGSLTP